MDIDSGVGSLEFKSGRVNNLKADLGIGSTTFNFFLKGSNKVESGIGSVRLNLENNLEDLRFDVSKGIGSIKLNSDSMKKGNTGNGETYLHISNGIGSVDIKTLD